MKEKLRIIIAIGGNSLIAEDGDRSFAAQYKAVCETAKHIADIIAKGYIVCITHGNGPQVGFILERTELAQKILQTEAVPLVSCVADTQGAIGWQIQQAVANELRHRKIPNNIATVVTQVRIDTKDSAFANPTKFIGGAYSAQELSEIQQKNPNWILKEDVGRGWRRVVPSPQPLEIMELSVITSLLESGTHIICAGGGGIPVAYTANNYLRGVDAVIDKDLASSLLASTIGAKELIISTGVEKVCIHFATPQCKNLDTVTCAEIEQYLGQGQFPAGSMGPKIQAAIQFLHNGGEKVIITRPDCLAKALAGETGTHIIP